MRLFKTNRQALKIAIYFALIGVLWILFSDKLVIFYFDSHTVQEQIQTFKGWFFVLATSFLIYYLIRKQLNIIQRKNIELSKSIYRYRSTLDNMLEGAQIINHNWVYVYVNDVVAEHGKKTKSELLGKTMMEAYPGIEKTQLFGQLKLCMEKRVSRRIENEFDFADGSKGFFELSIQPVPEGIFILSYDITERINAEKDLKIGEDRLIEAQRIAKLGDFTWHVESGEVTWSAPLYELLGYDKSEKITYEKVNNYVHHPDDLNEILDWLNKSLKSDSDILPPKEYRLLKKNGEVIYVITQGKIINVKGNKKVFATVQDITYRKEAEQELNKYRNHLEKLVEERTEKLYKSEEKYRALYESIRDGLLHVKMDGKIIECNPEFVKMIGYSKEELKNLTLIDLVPEEYQDQLPYIINDQILEKGYTDEFEKEYRRKDGTVIPVAIRAWLVKDKEGNPESMWKIVRNITKRKEYEKFITTLNDHLKERQIELEMANKELEAFAYSVSHDLRAPLRAIDGFTNILMEDYINDLDEEALRLGNVIQENSKKMGQLIDDLLSFSRMGRASMNPSNINMKNMAESIYHEASTSEQRDKIDFQLTDLPRIKADPNMMRHVWMNLISNAIKYSSTKDKIKIKIDYEVKENHVTYSIQDNGVGFDMKHKEKLFGVFQRLHSPKDFEGTGVGLALVHRIISRHRGEIWADAEPDKGAVFYFSLPKK